MNIERSGKGIPRRDAKPSSAQHLDDAKFAAWFGESKIIDERGQPLTMYHGSRSKFKVFLDDRPIWFTKNEIYAKAFCGRDTSPLRAHLCINNPVFVGAIDGVADARSLAQLSRHTALSSTVLIELLERSAGRNLYHITNSPEFRSLMIAAGYDGIEAHEARGSTTYAAFCNTQIQLIPLRSAKRFLHKAEQANAGILTSKIGSIPTEQVFEAASNADPASRKRLRP